MPRSSSATTPRRANHRGGARAHVQQRDPHGRASEREVRLRGGTSTPRSRATSACPSMMVSGDDAIVDETRRLRRATSRAPSSSGPRASTQRRPSLPKAGREVIREAAARRAIERLDDFRAVPTGRRRSTLESPASRTTGSPRSSPTSKPVESASIRTARSAIVASDMVEASMLRAVHEQLPARPLTVTPLRGLLRDPAPEESSASSEGARRGARRPRPAMS